MKRTLVYEVKRNLLPLAVFCMIAAAVAVVSAFTAQLSYGFGTRELADSCVGVFSAILCVLCAVVPVMQFSYRMKQRSADLWYSLPVGRKKLALVRVLGGLILVFLPYTLAYWLGVGCVAMQEGRFAFVHYLSLWAASLPLGVLLFGMNAFVFTRGNTAGDGIVFLILWACLLPLAVLVCFSGLRFTLGWDPEIPEYLNYYSGVEVAAFFFPYSPVGYLSQIFDALICGRAPGDFALFSLWFILPFAVIGGVGAYAGLFLCADRDKAENAGQISSSWMGYRVLIPAYIVLLLGAVGVTFDGEVVMGVLVAVVGAALYFAYRRSFRLKKEDIIIYIAAVLVGAALALILFYCV